MNKVDPCFPELWYDHADVAESTVMTSWGSGEPIMQRDDFIGKSGGDTLRMANNILKLREAQKLKERIHMSQHVLLGDDNERKLQVMTFSMEEFTSEPKDATLRLLDFALGNASPPDAKERSKRILTILPAKGHGGRWTYFVP